MSHFYVTRDPLKGVVIIDERTAAVVLNEPFIRLVFIVRGRYKDTAYNEGRDWHRTAEAANQRMRAMRGARIRQLQREIAKLKKLQKEGKP